MKFKEIIEKLDENVFTPELKNEVAKAFNEAVDEKVKSVVDMEVENALIKMDEDCSEKLKNLLEKMDVVHTARLDTLVKAMDRDFTKKLYVVYEKYNKEMTESADGLRKFFESAISQYLDAYLDEVFPANIVQESVENNKAAIILSQIRDVVGLDADFMSESVKGAIRSAHNEIESLKEANTNLATKNSKLLEESNRAQSKLFLESRLAGANAEKRDFFMRRLQGKTAEEVQSNYAYVEEMYKRELRERQSILKEASVPKTVTFSRKIDRPVRSVITESKEPELNPYVRDGLIGLEEQ